jgi:hypothetical protein
VKIDLERGVEGELKRRLHPLGFYLRRAVIAFAPA